MHVLQVAGEDAVASLLPYKDGLVYDPVLNTSRNKWLWHGTRSTAPMTVRAAELGPQGLELRQKGPMHW